MLIRFSAANEIMARDGAGYGCDGNCPGYLADTWYHFSGTANVGTATYSVQYETCDDGLVALATNFAFRTSALPVASLGYHAAAVDTTGTVEVDQMTWVIPGTETITVDFSLAVDGGIPGASWTLLDGDLNPVASGTDSMSATLFPHGFYTLVWEDTAFGFSPPPQEGPVELTEGNPLTFALEP
jgi:hypothetical protein